MYFFNRPLGGEQNSRHNVNNRKERENPLFCCKNYQQIIDITIAQFLNKCKFTKRFHRIDKFAMHGFWRIKLDIFSKIRIVIIGLHLEGHLTHLIVPCIQSMILIHDREFVNLLLIKIVVLLLLLQFVSQRFPLILELH